MQTAQTQPTAKRRLWPFALGIPAFAAAVLLAWPPLLTRIADRQFLPHRYCYLADPQLTRVHVISDLLIGAAYVAISATLAYLVHRARKDIPFSWMFLAFGLFIVACGGTHFMEVLTTVGPPLYWLSGDLKVVTAAASIATAIALPRLVPQVIELMTLTRETAEQKVALEAANIRMRELEALSATLASRAAVGMATWEWNLDTDALAWSGDVESVFGWHASELPTAKEVFAIMHRDDVEQVRASVNESLHEDKDYDSEFRIVDKNGETRWLLGRGRVVRDASGRAVSIVGVNMDVTVRKLTERALQQSEKLNVAGRLAASIAHEINNPLEGVVNIVYLIQHTSSDQGARELAGQAQAELQRVAHIVRQTLGFYRESGAPAKIDVSEVLRNVGDLLSTHLRSKRIQYVTRCKGNVQLIGIFGEIRQIIANLVGNAVDASDRGATINVRARATVRNGVDGVVITIADNGPGIPDPMRKKIFEPFFTTKGDRGTGLGLWVTTDIVHKHGGAIRFRTCTGEKHGTVFTVFLPREHAAAAEAPRSA